MNEFIGWIANNNTLLIRIGFTAVILLLLVYVFRLFFVPRINEPVAVAGDMNDANDAEQVKSADNPASKDELVKLQAEISTLKFKLKEVEVEKAELIKQGKDRNDNHVEANVERASIMQSNSSPNSDRAVDEQSVQLSEKIKALEARLAEYEIIAEDIAEISLLRTENDHLKSKVSDLEGRLNISITANEPEPVEKHAGIEELLAVGDSDASADDISNEIINVEEPAIAETDTSERDLLAAELEAEAEKILASQAGTSTFSEEQSATSSELSGADGLIQDEVKKDMGGHVVVNSDVEVTTDEQNILNEFENFKKVKKG